MDNITIVALAKVLEKQAKAIAISAGTYAIDTIINLSVKGQLRKSEDVEYTPTVDIPLLMTLALVMKKAGFQRENAKQILIEAMTEAINNDEKASPIMAQYLLDVTESMNHVRQVTEALPKKIRSGPTMVNVVLEAAA